KNQQKFVEAFEKIDYSDYFILESICERLDKYDVSTPSNLQALTDVIIMLCICPTKLTSLCITNNKVIGYAKNQRQQDIFQVFKSIEKNKE
ncbi:589_t:CDS:1, partial [Cetraspora pellucida]